MAAACLDRGSESNSADEPIEHEDKADGRAYAGETQAEVKCQPSPGSLRNQINKTREVFEDLKKSVIASTKVFESKLAKLNAKEDRLIELSTKIPSINFESAIKLNVGGIVYQTSLETLRKYQGSLLSEMFSERFSLKQEKDGSYFIDRDGTHFRHILNYLRSGIVPVFSGLNTDTKEILREAEFYGLVGLVNAINSKLNGDGSDRSEIVKEECEIAVLDVVDDVRKDLCDIGQKLNSFLDLLNDSMKALDEAASHHKEITMKLSNVHFGENVKIDVGGRIFKTSLKTLRRESDSVLALMFSENYDLKKEDDGSFFIDRDGTLFHHILNYLRDGKISEDVIEDIGLQIHREAEFYGLSCLQDQIHNYSQVRLNVGGRDFVVKREVLKKYPDSILNRMLSGEECAFIKSQNGSFHIDRDGTNFHHILEYIRYGTISDDIVETCASSLLDDAKFYMFSWLRSHIIHNFNYLIINIRGKELIISHRVLDKFPGSLFGKMLAGEKGNYVKRYDGSYYVQRDAANFNHILTFLRSGTLTDDVIERHGALLIDDAEFYMLPCMKERINNYHNVKMVIGGKEFVVPREVLSKVPDSIFARMLKGERGTFVKQNDGSYVLERNSKNFNNILTFLRSGTLSDDVIQRNGRVLADDAEFFILPCLKQRVINYYNVKMIIGGKEFIVPRDVLSRFKDSLFEKMLKGERGAYVKRSDGSYVIERDSTNFNEILTFLKLGALSDDVIEKHSALLLDDAQFYMLPLLERTVSSRSAAPIFLGRKWR